MLTKIERSTIIKSYCTNCGRVLEFQSLKPDPDNPEAYPGYDPVPVPCPRCSRMVQPGDSFCTGSVVVPESHELFGIAPLVAYDHDGYPGDSFIIDTFEAIQHGLLEAVDLIGNEFRLKALGYGLLLVPKTGGA